MITSADLRDLRRVLGVQAPEWAARAGYSVGHINAVLSNQSRLTPQCAEDLLQALVMIHERREAAINEVRERIKATGDERPAGKAGGDVGDTGCRTDVR